MRKWAAGVLIIPGKYQGSNFRWFQYVVISGMLKCNVNNSMSLFQLVTDYKPSGDQEQAIAKLLKSLRAGNRHQCLLGVTGSGKTFTMANIIANVNKPTLVLAHNKTLAAQLCSEFREFFPNNAVEYFISYNRFVKKSVQNSTFCPQITVFLGQNNTKIRFAD